MHYNFDKIVDRRGTNCDKYDKLLDVFTKDDITPLWVADTDFETPDFIIEAIKKRAEHPILGYSYRCQDYFKSIQGWMKRRYSWSVDINSIEFSPGVVCGISQSLCLLSKAGDTVVIQTPIYPPFARTIKANDRVVATNPLICNNGQYEVDFENLEDVLQKASIFILCNPHNPTGKLYTPTELRRIGELCIKYGVKIISDDIHADIVYNKNTYTPISTISKEIADITVTFIAPSKTFNLAGLSTSAAVITNPQIMAMYRGLADKIHVGQGNIFGAVALQTAYNMGDEWLNQLLTYLYDNAQFVVEYIKNNIPAIKCEIPQATFLIWLDCRGLNLNQQDLCSFMVNEAKLGLTNGADFGDEGVGFMRLNIGTTKAVLKEALDKLKLTCNKL